MSYRYMRMLLMFDMPTDTAKEKPIVNFDALY